MDWPEVGESVARPDLREIAAKIGQSIASNIGVIHRGRLDCFERGIEGSGLSQLVRQ